MTATSYKVTVDRLEGYEEGQIVPADEFTEKDLEVLTGVGVLEPVEDEVPEGEGDEGSDPDEGEKPKPKPKPKPKGKAADKEDQDG